jgi:hypothetical protein
MNDSSDLIFMMAAMVLFSILVNNSNRVFVRNNMMSVESSVEVNAIAMAQSLIDEARTKAFDRATTTASNELGDPGTLTLGQIPSGFTPPAALGPDAGEVYPNFNDFDDYHNLALTRTNGYGDFQIRATVSYVTPANPTVNAGTQTIMKRLEVVVSSDRLQNTVTLSYNRTHF